MASLDRTSLPIADREFEGTLPYDAKDPAASFPPIEPLRPPAGAPNVLVVLLDDVGFGASSAFGGPCATPTAERLAASGLKYNRFHTTALCSPTRAALLTGRNHHTRRAWAASPRSPPRPPATARCGRTPARRWPRPCCSTATRPRSSASATRCRCGRPARSDRSTPGRPAAAGSSTSTASSAARPTSTTRRSTRARRRSSPTKTPEEGYHFTEDMTDQAIGWVRQQKSLMPDKPFFVYYAPGRDPRAPPRAHGVVGQVPGPVRRRLGRAARGDLRPPEGAGRDPPRRRADRAARRDPGLGRHARRAQAGAGPADGGLRRVPRAHRPPHRPARRRARGPRRPRRHARLLHHRRQRRHGRGHRQRLLQRDVHLQRRRRAGDARVHGVADRRVRHARRPTTTTRSAGRTRWTRRTSGPSRSPRTGAAPATAPSCTGRTASRPGARSGPSSTTSSTWRRPCSRSPGCPSPTSSTASSSCRWRA